MYKKVLLLLFIMAAVLSASLFAQETETDSTYNKDNDQGECDSSEWSNDDEEDEDDFDDAFSEHWKNWHHEWSWDGFKGQPAIEATYGVSQIGIKSLSKNFADAGALQLKMSYSSLRSRGNYVAKYKNDYGFISTNSMDLNSKAAPVNELTSETWRFGLGWERAYAYKFGNSAIIPYNTFGFVWTKIDKVRDRFPETALNIPPGYNDFWNRIDDYQGSFRFGQLAEGGIKIQIVPLLTFNAGYERAIVFRRHLFWKHMGSLIVEGAGMGLIDGFVSEVLRSSPSAAPIVNFVLKNGFSYGLYQLRKEKMNWPFNTAEPLTYDTWKIGMTFTF